MYPHLTLKIEDQIPQILFFSEENVSRRLTQQNENILDEIVWLAEELELAIEGSTKEERINSILLIASEGDPEIIESLPSIDTTSLEFNLRKTLDENLKEIQNLDSDYSDLEMSDEVRAELDKNRKMDVLASLIDQLYNILIAKTLLAAYELELTDIHLSSDYNYARLTEKMGNEIQKLGLKFTID